MSDHYEAGTRVELVHTSDEYTRLRPGAKGTVTGGRKHGMFAQMWVKWDDGSSLALIPGEDQWRVLKRGSRKLTPAERVLAWLQERPMTKDQLMEVTGGEIPERSLRRILSEAADSHKLFWQVGEVWHTHPLPDPVPAATAALKQPRLIHCVCPSCLTPAIPDELGRCQWCERQLLSWSSYGTYRHERVESKPKANRGIPWNMQDDLVDEAYALYCSSGRGVLWVAGQLLDRAQYKSAHTMGASLLTQWALREWPVRERICAMVTFNYRHGKLSRQYRLRDRDLIREQRIARGDQQNVRCIAVRSTSPHKGQRCKHWALVGSEYCNVHDPARRERIRQQMLDMRERARAQGIDLHPNRLRPEEIAEMVRLRDEGLTTFAISRRVGRSWPAVKRALGNHPNGG